MGESHLVCLNKSFHSRLSSFLVLIESVSLKISISSSRIDNGRVKYFYHFLRWLPWSIFCPDWRIITSLTQQRNLGNSKLFINVILIVQSKFTSPRLSSLLSSSSRSLTWPSRRTWRQSWARRPCSSAGLAGAATGRGETSHWSKAYPDTVLLLVEIAMLLRQQYNAIKTQLKVSTFFACRCVFMA